MTTTLVLPDELFRELADAARLPVETAAVVLASVVTAPNGDIRILGRKIRWVEEQAYFLREPLRLSIASEGYVAALAEAETMKASCIWFHTHPGDDASPRPSVYDHQVDEEIADLFRLRSGSEYYGTLIISPRGDGIAFTGTLQPENAPALPLDRLWKVGDGWTLVRSFDSELPSLSSFHDRSIRAFGAEIQRTLSALHVGIVGCGGTGSAVAEQLVRLGVRHLTLIDPDDLAETNISRLYGSTPEKIGRPKVNLLKEHLTSIAPDLACDTRAAMVTLEKTARALIACDMVFGCTDDNAGRLVLSRLATYLLVPVIDCGVLLTSNDAGRLIGIDGRITILSPGSGCLVCRDRIDVQRAAVELLTPEERRRRIDEGYAPALGRVEPAVVTYTTAIAANAVAELIERLVNYGPQPRPSEILVRFHDREISTNVALPRKGHYCHPASGKWGNAAVAPFLEQVWPDV